MKYNTACTVFTLLLMSICSLPSPAQEKSEGYKGYIVWEDVVYPSKYEAYEKATKMQIELFAEQNFPNWTGVFTTSDFTYYW
ncbi:MAG: hypothetical protein KAT15_11130, partial [Bacteroidales bacterium]|nr:hypothetical protein [Bacteroidales bacterium]